MVDAKPILSDNDEGPPIFWVSFCGELGIYHLHREVEGYDPQDSKLTRDELHCLVDGMLASGQAAEAQQITTMCAWARLFEHQIVVFHTSGSFKIYKPVPPPAYEVEDSEDMKKYQEVWKKDHLMANTVPPVVTAYPSQKNLRKEE
jgi:hypothetical protein